MKLLNVDLLDGTSLTAEFARRPLLLIFIGLAVGIAAPIAPGALVVLLGVLVWLKALKPWACLIPSFLIGLMLSPTQVARVESDSFVTVSGRIGSTPSEGTYGFRCRLVTSQNQFLLAGTGSSPVRLGEQVEVKGVLRPFQEESSAVYIQRGLQGKLQVDPGGVVVLYPAPWLLRVSDSLRESFKGFLSKSLKSREASLAGALCMSLNGEIEPEMMDSLKSTGTIHLISASGLHFMFLSMALFGVFSVTPLPRPLVWWIVAMIMLIYGLAAGLHPPVIRAICVILIAKSATFFRRDFDTWSALALVGGGYLLFEPRALFEIGFQLSFLTVAFFGLVSYQPEERWQDRVVQEARSCGIAFLATLPLIAYHQGYFGLTSPLANLLLVFVLPWVLLGSFVGFALSLISVPLAAAWMQAVVEPLLGWVQAVLKWTGIPEAQVAIPAFSGYLLLMVYGLALLAWRRKRVEA